MRTPGFTAEASLDLNVKHNNNTETFEAPSIGKNIFPQLSRSIDTFCYIGCRQFGLSAFMCLRWCGESEINQVSISNGF